MMLPTVTYDHQIFALQRYGGISRYFCELASRVHASREFRARVVAPLHFNQHLNDCDAPCTGLHVPPGKLRVARLYQALDRLVEPTLLSLARPAILHRTYYGASAAPRGVPNIVTVFDMIHELFAGEFPTSDATSQNKRLSVSQADHVLCISQSTANDLMRLFGTPPEKISVTYLGLSGAFTACSPLGEDSPHGRPYLLYVGHRGGYKNFATALRAYASSRHLREALDFVAFGGLPWRADEVDLVASLNLGPHKVHRLAGSDADLARAYRHARAFVYPSLYEGFGIPPLEAMSSRCPVACSSTSSLPEVVGDAAALFDPKNVDSVREALERVCFDEACRARLHSAAERQLTKFTWDACAAGSIEAYRATLGAQ